MAYILDNSISIMFVTETWLLNKKNDVTAKIKSYGYTIIHEPRSSSEKSSGGGVAIIFDGQVLKLTETFIEHGKSFEVSSANLSQGVCALQI